MRQNRVEGTILKLPLVGLSKLLLKLRNHKPCRAQRDKPGTSGGSRGGMLIALLHILASSRNSSMHAYDELSSSDKRTIFSWTKFK